VHDVLWGGEAGKHGAGVNVLERLFVQPFVFGIIDFEGAVCWDAECVSNDLSLGWAGEVWKGRTR